MKNTLKKTLAMGLVLVMLVCTCFCTTAFAASENVAATPRDIALGTVIFSSANYNGDWLPDSASKSISSLNQSATKALIKVIPYTPGQTGSVNVKITASNPLFVKDVTVTVGTDKWVDLSGWGYNSKVYTVTYSGATIKLSHIGVTFGR